MEFRKVRIQNFKGIENMELCFRPGINLVLGENGVGKTSILEAMTIAFGDYFNGIAGVSKKGIVHEQIRFRTSLSGDASTKIEYFTPTTVQSEIHLDKEELALAEWFEREEIPVEPVHDTLTNEMIIHFKYGSNE